MYKKLFFGISEKMDVKRVAWLLLEFAVLIVIFTFWQLKDSIIPHTKIGFFCGDASLSYPYMKASIPTEWLYISLYIVPISIWLIELSIEFIKDRNEIKKKFLTTSLRSLKWFIYYYVTFMILMIFLTLLKNLVGGLRPFFFEMCQPDLARNCSLGEFVNFDYKCTNPIATEYIITEIRRSFPSGHAMGSVYITFFFMRYMEARFSKFRVTLSALHFLCITWVVVCCVSRIIEHYHHVGDVIAGIILALPFLLYSTQILCKDFETTKRKHQIGDIL
ncbi:Phospholipid phosphatase 3 [Pseudolycoriella hygida]|uniref:Phospholipid phosphatase 3 n=1 Tax=Pseudolycoriella hygida TaxID=35572 RepID=A0A9Q0SA83_9DIPT|nr:Phospholipid phosphatase 3 [Pseudolycoriella hygida]